MHSFFMQAKFLKKQLALLVMCFVYRPSMVLVDLA